MGASDLDPPGMHPHDAEPPEPDSWERRYGRLQERSRILWRKWHDAHPANEAVYREKYRKVQEEIEKHEAELSDLEQP